MIEVTVTHDEILRYVDEPTRGRVPPAVWASICSRQKLIDAGIPLCATFDPLGDLRVLEGRIEWWYDSPNKTKVYRWYPPPPIRDADADDCGLFLGLA